MELAEKRPLPRKLFAAMAQQDCGQCGYLCESYADKLANGEETRVNLCVPGGKETSRMLKALLQDVPVEPANPKAEVPEMAPAPSQTSQSGSSRERPATAVLKSVSALNGPGSQKDTRHIVFDISDSGMAYEPGDSFGLLPRNDPELVDAVLAAMNAPHDFPVAGTTLRKALLSDYSLGAAPDMLFELASYMVGGARRQKLKALAKGQDPDGDAASFDVLKVLEDFGPIHPDPEAFLEALDPLQPRLYSISSSPLATPGELHLTVDTVRYDIEARRRLGVASTFLADRCGRARTLRSTCRRHTASPFRPMRPCPSSWSDLGPALRRSARSSGTASRARLRVRPGCSSAISAKPATIYYRDEFERLQRSGTLTRLSTAWSRDGEKKVYVQDRMREEGAELWSWLRRGAHFYVCGDAKRMAKDVEQALADIAQREGHMSAAGARDFVAELKAAGRYQADVY